MGTTWSYTITHQGDNQIQQSSNLCRGSGRRNPSVSRSGESGGRRQNGLEKERTAEPPELNGHGETLLERQKSPVASIPAPAVAAAVAKDVPTVAVTSATKEEERPQQSYLGKFLKIYM